MSNNGPGRSQELDRGATAAVSKRRTVLAEVHLPVLLNQATHIAEHIIQSPLDLLWLQRLYANRKYVKPVFSNFLIHRICLNIRSVIIDTINLESQIEE